MRKHVAVALTCLMMISLLAGCGNNSNPTVKNVTQKVSMGQINSVSVITGKIEPLNMATITSKISGKIINIQADIQSQVSKGQTLLTLDTEDLSLGVDSARAAVVSANSSVAVAKAAIKTAQINYNENKKNYERGLQLIKSQAISQYAFDNDYEKPYKLAEASLDAAQASLNASLAQVGAAEVNLKKAQTSLNDSIIKSPLSGIVTSRNVNVGEIIGTSTTLFTVMNIDKVYVKSTVTEDQINNIKKGQKLSVKVASVADNFEGVVSNISYSQDAQAKAYVVKIEINNSNHILKPGMFAEIYLSPETIKGIIVPVQAIKDTTVSVIENGVTKLKKVKTGPSDGKNIIVTDGLSVGDEIIIPN